MNIHIFQYTTTRALKSTHNVLIYVKKYICNNIKKEYTNNYICKNINVYILLIYNNKNRNCKMKNK